MVQISLTCQQSAGAALSVENMTSHVVTLVESLPTSSIAEQWQIHPWAEHLEEKN